MKGFFPLLKLSFTSLLLTTFQMGRGKNKAKAASGVGALVLLCALMVFMSASYSFGLGAAFGPIGALDIMLMIIIIMSVVFPFIFIMFAAQSLVFSTKDVDLVLSLPVSSFSVMLARVLALYLEALLMCELLLLPAGVAYLAYGGAGGAGFIVLLFILGIFLALIPTLASLIFGFVIALLISRLRFKNLFNVLFSLLFIVVIMVGSFGLSFSMNSAEVADVGGLRQSLVSAVPPLSWAISAVGGHILHLLAIVAITLVPFLLVTWVFSRFYKSMLTHLSSHRLRTDYKLREVAASGSFGALFQKETRKFFGTPALVLNGGVGVLMILIASVAAVIFKGKIATFLAELAAVGGGEIIATYLPPMLLLALAFFASMTYISCVSISLEGKTLWILKEAPLSTGKIFAAKAGFNFLLGGLCVVICAPLLGFAFSLSVADTLAILLLCLLLTALTSTAGLYINLVFPRMDAENDTLIIKQSASVVITMLLMFLIIGLGALLYFVLQGLGFLLFSAITGVVLLALNALVLLLLNTNGRKRFAAL